MAFSLKEQLLSEFLGAAILSAGCLGYTHNEDPTQGARFLGVVSSLVVHVFGVLSGGQGHPVVTLACYHMGYLPMATSIIFIIAQMAGGFAGFLMLAAILPDSYVSGAKKLCLCEPNKVLEWQHALALECLFTTIVLLQWIMAWDVRRLKHKPLMPNMIGLAVIVCSVIANTLTGSSINIARTVAAAAYHGVYKDLHLYIGGQILAVFPACFIMQFINKLCDAFS